MRSSDGSTPLPPQVAEAIVDRARELGFALAGVIPARPTDHEAELRAWLARGEHGSMHYLEEHADLRVDPSRVLRGCRSVILAADQYAARPAADVPRAPGRGRVARYARGDDYHKVLTKRLHTLADELRLDHPSADFRAFCDTAPILEREHAARAGLGWIGKHTLLIHPRRGSYLLLGGVLTTLDLTPPRTQRQTPDRCGSCTRCIDACPTDAITPYSVDASKCISYLTIERRGPIDEPFHEPIGEWLFGCDICQEVCPHNSARDRIPVGRAHPAYAERRDSFDLLEVLGWTEADRRSAFERSALKRAKLGMMRRNAVIAAANALADHDLPELRARITSIARDPDEEPIVREAARAAVGRLERTGEGPGPRSP